MIEDRRRESHEAASFQLTTFGALLGARSLPGLASIMLSARGDFRWSGVLLLLAAVADLLVDSFAGRVGWHRRRSELEIEGFVDFACFVWAPVQLVISLVQDWPVLLATAIFVLAGGFRLARFNVEGMENGAYRGLPVTYAGVIFPLLILVFSWLDRPLSAEVAALALLGCAILMASGRFRTRRVSI